MAKSFLKKETLKKGGIKLANASLRIAGAASSGLVSNKLIGDKLDKKYHGPIIAAVGILGELFIEQPQISAFAQGMTTYGGLQTIGKTFFPEHAQSMGLSGDGDYDEYELLNGDDDTPDEYDTPVDGIDEAVELLNGYNQGDDLLNGDSVYTPEEMEMINQFD